MNYYIQGNKEKADQIKTAFEQLGYDISWPEGCANPDVINIGVERNGGSLRHQYRQLQNQTVLLLPVQRISLQPVEVKQGGKELPHLDSRAPWGELHRLS